MKKFVVLEKHSKDCFAIQPQNHPDGPWVGIPSKRFGNNKDGLILGSKGSPNRKGCALWIAVICNSTICNGVLAVNMNEVLNGAPKGGQWKRRKS